MQDQEFKKVKVDSDDVRVSSLPRSLSDDYMDRMGRLIELTEAQKVNLKGWLKARLEEYESDTAELHQNLEYDNDLVEGIVYETDYPWEGASNVHVGMPEIYMELYESIQKRSILGADTIWYAEMGEGNDDPQLAEIMPDIDTMLNYKARNEWNTEKALKGVFWVTNRDGLGAIEVTWVERYKKSSDIILLTSEEDFLKEFPTPEDAGMTEDEWFELANEVQRSASDEFPVEVPVTFEKQIYKGCWNEVVDLVDFVTIPASVPDIRDELCRGYGRRYLIRSGTIRKNVKDKYFYEDESNSLLKADGYTESAFTLAQDQIDGLQRTNKKGTYKVYCLNIIGTLNGINGEIEGDERYDEEMEFTVIYSKEHDKLLRLIEYPYRICNYAIFRIDSRPNRLRGRSIPDKTRDLSDEMDTQHNQRINSRTISTVPVFKALFTKKLEIDGMLQEQKFKPGRVFYVSDFNSFDQFRIQPTDLGESMQEEKNSQSLLDLKLGSSAALLSGQAPTGDPNAPGNKTAMLISQSNLRMDNPLDELREGVEQLGDIHLSHLYQFGPTLIPFKTGQDGRTMETKTIHKKYLRKGLRMKMSGVNVVLNPEYELQKAFQMHQMLMTEPLYMQNPQLRIEGLRIALKAGRVPNRSKLLPPAEEIQRMQVEMQKQAMMQMEQEKQMAMAAQAEEEIKNRLSNAKRQLDIKNTSRRMAESYIPNGASGGPNGTSGTE